jgi:hypothetical protein
LLGAPTRSGTAEVADRDDDGVVWKLANARSQLIRRNIDCAIDVPLGEFVGRPYVVP